MTQHEYMVTWSIEVTASSPEEAAQQALAIHRDPSSLATCFMVAGGDIPEGKRRMVDLDGLIAVVDTGP